MKKHNLIIKGIAKSWNDEDLNRYIDELMQEIRQDEREQEQKRIIEIIKKLIDMGDGRHNCWIRVDLLKQQIREEKKQ